MEQISSAEAASPSGTSEMSKAVMGQIPTCITILSIICAIGTVGNLLVLYVYSLKNDRQTATLFILVLAAADCITCSVIIPYSITTEYLQWKLPSVYLCKAYYLLNSSGIPFSSLIISAIAVDRYFCICHPFLHIMTIRRAKVVIGVLASTALTLGILTMMQISLMEVRDSGHHPTNQTFFVTDNSSSNITSLLPSSYECVEITKLGVEMSTLQKVLYHISQKGQTVSFLICIVLVIVLYISIYRTVLNVRRKRLELKGLRQAKSPAKPLLSPPPPTTQVDNASGDISASRESITQQSSPLDVVEPANGMQKQSPACQPCPSPSPSPLPPQAMKSKDTSNFQNFKTAIMLFVVAITYIISFLPACLMANGFVRLYLPVFYMYYFNSAANPIIYCFMNKNFRDDIRRIFCDKRKQQNGNNAYKSRTTGKSVV